MYSVHAFGVSVYSLCMSAYFMIHSCSESLVFSCSASTTAPNPTISRMPEGVTNLLAPDQEGDEVEIFSVLLLDENTFEGLAHSTHHEYFQCCTHV